MAIETEAAVVTAPTTTGDALSRARAYVAEFAADAVKDSHPNLEEADDTTEAKPKADAEIVLADETDEADTKAQKPEDKPETAEEEETPTEDTSENLDVTPEVQEAINKRIGREVAKTKEAQEAKTALEARMVELETALATAQSAPVQTQVIAPNNPLSDVTDLNALSKKRTEVEGLRSHVANLIEDVEDDPEMVESELKKANINLSEYTPKEMRRALRTVEKNLKANIETFIPQREAFIKEEAVSLQAVREALPELKSPVSDRSRLFNSILQTHPILKMDPRWPAIVASIMVVHEDGVKRNGTKTASEAKAKPAPPQIPAKTKAGASSTPSTRNKAADADLHKQMLSGSREARVALLENMLK